jgi:DNA uptake protein ComE-like DNA-binding protein
MTQLRYSCSRQQQGFVLVLTLWVLVIVSLAVAYFSERVTQAVQLAHQSRQNTNALIDMAGTRAEMLFRLGTTSLTEYGLGRGSSAVALDNRSYQGQGNTQVRLQDNRGLINLNFAEDDRLQRFLGLLGIPAEQRPRMVDTLRDYTDPDNLHRLNGAEQDQYQALGLPPPSNANLITPWQAHSIIAWRDAPQLWQNSRLAELATVGLGAGINPNTAPAEVLATLPGITEEIARRIITRREQQPITNIGQLAEIATLNAQQLADEVSFIPSSSLRMTQSSQGIPWSLQYNLTLTPNGIYGPWRIDYYGRVSNSGQEGRKDAVMPLPERSTSPPEAAPL